MFSKKTQSQYWHLDCLQQEDYFSGAVNLTGWYWAKHELLFFIQTFSNMSWTSKCKLSSMIFILNILLEYISCSSTLQSKIQNFMDHAGNAFWGFTPVCWAPRSQLCCPRVLCSTDNSLFELILIICAIYWDLIWWFEVVDHWVFFTSTFFQRPDIVQIRIWEMLKNL